MFAVGDKVRQKRLNGLVGEVVEVKERGGGHASYLVWCPATGNLEIVLWGDDIEPAEETSASHLRAALSGEERHG